MMSQQQNSSEASSSATSSYFDDHRHYRPLRMFIPSPYRSQFHTSAISLLDIKEAATEEEDSSCSSNSVKQHNNTDHNIRDVPEQVWNRFTHIYVHT